MATLDTDKVGPLQGQLQRVGLLQEQIRQIQQPLDLSAVGGIGKDIARMLEGRAQSFKEQARQIAEAGSLSQQARGAQHARGAVRETMAQFERERQESRARADREAAEEKQRRERRERLMVFLTAVASVAAVVATVAAIVK